MPISLSPLRAYLVADAQDHPLPTPQPLNLATDVIPYGATVRFEIDVTSDEPVLPLDVEVSTANGGGAVEMYPVGSSNTFAAEVRMPWGILAYAAIEGPATSPRFPLEAPAPGAEFTLLVQEHGESKDMTTPPVIDGWPRLPGGDYLFRTTPWSVAAAANGQAPATFETSFRVGDPPSPGGAPPRITRLESGLADSSVLVGQPWLLTAAAADADNDVLGVIFSALRGTRAVLALMKDDGSCGDQRARDGVYSFLRIGGDSWEGGQWTGSRDVPVTLSAQAVDLRGNWSEPALLNYRLHYSEFPLWAADPAPDGPNIVEVGIGRQEGLPDFPRGWARCDDPNAWVCACLRSNPDEVGVLLDDGKGADAAAADGIHSAFTWFSPGFLFARQKQLDVVFYAMLKAGPPKIGRRMAVNIPPAL